MVHCPALFEFDFTRSAACSVFLNCGLVWLFVPVQLVCLVGLLVVSCFVRLVSGPFFSVQEVVCFC